MSSFVWSIFQANYVRFPVRENWQLIHALYSQGPVGASMVLSETHQDFPQLLFAWLRREYQNKCLFSSRVH